MNIAPTQSLTAVLALARTYGHTPRILFRSVEGANVTARLCTNPGCDLLLTSDGEQVTRAEGVERMCPWREEGK